MSNHYKHITLEGVQYIQAVNPFVYTPRSIENRGVILSVKDLENNDHREFAAANPPIIWYGEAFEGTISEEEIEFFPTYLYNGKWLACLNMDAAIHQGYEIKQVARLKAEKVEQPVQGEKLTTTFKELGKFYTPEKLDGLEAFVGKDETLWPKEQPVQQEEPKTPQCTCRTATEAYHCTVKCDEYVNVQPSTPIVEPLPKCRCTNIGEQENCPTWCDHRQLDKEFESTPIVEEQREENAIKSAEDILDKKDFYGDDDMRLYYPCQVLEAMEEYANQFKVSPNREEGRELQEIEELYYEWFNNPSTQIGSFPEWFKQQGFTIQKKQP